MRKKNTYVFLDGFFAQDRVALAPPAGVCEATLLALDDLAAPTVLLLLRGLEISLRVLCVMCVWFVCM